MADRPLTGALAGYTRDSLPAADCSSPPPHSTTLMLWKQVLKAHGAQVIEILRAWDETQSGRVSRRDFCQCVSLLGPHDGDELTALFDQYDTSGLGAYLLLAELESALMHDAPASPELRVISARTPLAATREAASLRTLGGGGGGGGGGGKAEAMEKVLSEAEECALSEEVHAFLARQVLRVVALFTTWDRGFNYGAGLVTQRAFRRALPCLVRRRHRIAPPAAGEAPRRAPSIPPRMAPREAGPAPRATIATATATC